MAEEDVVLRVRIRDRLQAAADLRSIAKEVENVEKVSAKTNVTVGEGEKEWDNWGSSGRLAAGGGLAFALFGVASAVASITEKVVESGVGWNAFQEDSQTSFKFILGDAGKAHTLLTQLQALNLHTSFQLPQLEQAAQQLLAVGFSARELVPTLSTLADLAAVNPLLGGEGLDRIAVVFGQIRSTGRLMAQDALQLTSLGIPVWQILADRAHTTKEQIRKDSEAGLISGTDAINAILAYSSKRYKGAADEQSKNFHGLVSNLTDEFNQFAGTLLLPAMKPLEGDLSKINAWLTSPAGKQFSANLSSAFIDIAHDIAPVVLGTAKLGAALGTVFGPEVKRALDDLAPLFMVLGAAESFAADHLQEIHDKIDFVVNPVGLLTRKLGGLQGIWQSLSSAPDINLDVVLHVLSDFLGGVLPGGHASGVNATLRRQLEANHVPVPAFLKPAHQASGGETTRAGWSWVGEEGPELMRMEQGAVVVSSARSQAIAASAAAPAQPRIIHVHVDVDRHQMAEVVYEDLEERVARR